MNGQLWVTKAGGDREIYNEDKVRESVRRAGIPAKYQDQVVNHVKGRLYQNIDTSEIYDLISSFLEKVYPQGNRRYHLKKAIMELGPSGYAFERYISELLKLNGYTTETGAHISGSCITHEVDVLARKDRRVYFVECKYHNQLGMRTDLKVALYVNARGLDLEERLKKGEPEVAFGSWIFTNTKFTEDAICYSECRKMRLTGWSYPSEGNLQEMIEGKRLYPVTILNSLTVSQKRKLVAANSILVKDVAANLDLLPDMDPHSREKLLYECNVLTE